MLMRFRDSKSKNAPRIKYSSAGPRAAGLLHRSAPLSAWGSPPCGTATRRTAARAAAGGACTATRLLACAEAACPDAQLSTRAAAYAATSRASFASTSSTFAASASVSTRRTLASSRCDARAAQPARSPKVAPSRPAGAVVCNSGVRAATTPPRTPVMNRTAYWSTPRRCWLPSCSQCMAAPCWPLLMRRELGAPRGLRSAEQP